MLTLSVLLGFGSACVEKSERPKGAVEEGQVGMARRPLPEPLVPLAVDAALTTTNDHFAHATAVKDTLLFADLANAQRMLASVVDSSGGSDEPTSWQPFTSQLRKIASEPTTQDPVADVARLAAKLGAECGACHLALAVDPHIALSAIGEPSEDFKNHMVGHKWALDRMWAGLATPSDALWKEGAALIADKPTHLKNLSNYKSQGELAIELAGRTHGLAARALKADGREERIDIFARFLGACASCHGLEGSGLGTHGAASR